MEIQWGMLVPETLSNVLSVLLATHVSFVLFLKRHLVTTGTTNKARYYFSKYLFFFFLFPPPPPPPPPSENRVCLTLIRKRYNLTYFL